MKRKVPSNVYTHPQPRASYKEQELLDMENIEGMESRKISELMRRNNGEQQDK
jgi:hypothetical protein